jgi:UDP-glucuronate decarboxylase
MSPDDGRVVSNFVVRALQGQPLEVYGDGSQTRAFCYIDDLVEAAIRMMAQDEQIGPVNLGNPEEFTIQQLADLVLELTGSSSSLVRRPLPPDDPVRRRPDISRARALLDWEPTVSLRDGLVRTIAFFDQLLRRG